jgi:hypothetical protein
MKLYDRTKPAGGIKKPNPRDRTRRFRNPRREEEK